MALKNYEHCCSTVQALSSLGKIEGVVPLLHGPQPCLFQNQVGSMSCRPAQLLTAGTLINKSEVIFGGEESLKQQVKNIYATYHPRMVVIINTCVPQLIGEDIEGVILELQEELPDLQVAYCNTGFNFPRSMPLGSDAAWAAIVDQLAPAATVSGSVGLVGRTGQDAGNMAAVEMLLKKAGIPTRLFPAAHLDEMARIVEAETIYPIHITPWLTCRALEKRFQIPHTYLEIPCGIEGTSNFLRGIAERLGNERLADLVAAEERRVQPQLDAIRQSFARTPVRMLLVTGPANEVSIGKILAEFGAEVFVVPCMRNAFYRQEKELMQTRYGVTFVEDDFETLGDVIDAIEPTVVSVEFQAQVETVPRFIPTLINMLYLVEYGYDYAIDLGTNFFTTVKQPVFDRWRNLMQVYGG